MAQKSEAIRACCWVDVRRIEAAGWRGADWLDIKCSAILQQLYSPSSIPSCPFLSTSWPVAAAVAYCLVRDGSYNVWNRLFYHMWAAAWRPIVSYCAHFYIISQHRSMHTFSCCNSSSCIILASHAIITTHLIDINYRYLHVLSPHFFYIACSRLDRYFESLSTTFYCNLI